MYLIILYLTIGMLSLSVGSFIGMTAYRLPKILYFNWFIDSYSFLNLQPKFNKLPELELNLFFPRSHCPNCLKKIIWSDNIPIISYFLLQGKCRCCKQKISVRYPIIESLTLFFSLCVFYRFGLGSKLIFGLILTWALLLQSVIDFEEYIIPDEITLPMLWLGLMINNTGIFTNLSNAVIGSILGYLSFWSIYWIFKIITGKDGLGYGDFKLLAMLGAWVGYQKLLLIVLFASVSGSLIQGILILLKKQSKDLPIPFGPYLAFSGWVIILLGNIIDRWYF